MSRFAWLAGFVCLMTASAASATSFSFHCISGDGGGDCTIPADTLWVDVQDEGSGEFSITLHNESEIRSPLTSLFVEDSEGLIAGLVEIDGSSGVSFEHGGKPPGLPSGTNEDFQEDWIFSALKPKPHNGVGPGEELVIVFTLADGFSYEDVIAAMSDGTLRLGVHAPPFGAGGNHSLVTGGGGLIPVPEPSALALLTVACAAWAVRRRRA
jgi:3',5'-cyclic AMP phosphodiesterase CpdA